MLNLDMTAFVEPGTTPVIAVITDFVDAELTEILGKLIAGN